ncbi:MAG: hypothetical protein COA79_07280 [Planctomycetota bacterium]|nr:MAG: hypothetical protein COA79_07280 [Planctomycetota bacterium]
MINRLFVVVLFLILTLPVNAQDEKFTLNGKTFLYIPYNKSKPLIDGKNSDEIWLDSLKFKLNKTKDLGPIPYYKTKVMVVADKRNLYFSFECFDPKMDKLTKGAIQKDDDKVFKEDYILLKFSTHKKNKEDVVSVVVTANGIVRDSKGVDASWNCKDFKFAMNKTKKSWMVEMSIPIASILGKSTDKLKTGLLMNVIRYRPEKGWDEDETSSWSRIELGSPKEFSDFGCIYLQAYSAKPTGVSKSIIQNYYHKSLPALEIKVVDKNFVIDGDIEEQIKEGIKPVEFKMLDGKNKKKPLNRTQFWIMTTKLEMIICIRNHESSMDKLKAVKNIRDKINWADDINEVFINIGEGADNNYYQIAVDAEGTLFDGYKKDNGSWNGNEIKVGVKKSEKYWDVEIKIPFDNLDMSRISKNFKKPWRMNLSRVRPKHTDNEEVEETAWSPTSDTRSGVPSKFGFLFMEVINAKLPK